MAKATTVAAGRPDVELRLTANEADALKALTGNLSLLAIEQILNDSDEDPADLPSARTLNTLVDEIYNELEDLNY